LVLRGSPCLSDFARQFGADPARVAFSFAARDALALYTGSLAALQEEWAAWLAED
jgi:hypothetical protein